MLADKKVLFVCTGNTCRSPMAEALFKKKLNGRSDFSVKSAGIAAAQGSPCSPETKEICDKLGAPLEGFKSQQVSPQLLEEATHVFAMTRAHLTALEEFFPEYSEKYYLVCEFTDLVGKGFGADILDPIGMGKLAYREVAKDLEKAIPSIMAYVNGMRVNE